MSFLSVIVDCNACNWGAFLEREGSVEPFSNVLSAIVAFSNAHMLSSLNNRLLLLAGGVRSREKKLFSTTNCSNINGAVHEVERKLREALSAYANDPSAASSSSSYAAAVSLSICAFQRYKREVNEPVGRIVIVNLTKDLAGEQNMLMNLFFSANQQALEVNVAALDGAVVPILQQACDITSGTHMLVTSRNLAPYLMQYCLGTSADCKEMFAPRTVEDVDYRATCHCHNNLVDVGYVCSVCLTVHCQFRPICMTCNVLFSLATAQKPAKRKRNGVVPGTTTNGTT